MRDAYQFDCALTCLAASNVTWLDLCMLAASGIKGDMLVLDDSYCLLRIPQCLPHLRVLDFGTLFTTEVSALLQYSK
jgi:hypothetical protein